MTGRPKARSERQRVAVVGGGWAGLAAAVEASVAGNAVTLFEMAPQLGGRARRVNARAFALDNGQHILIGAYTATLQLMRTVGVDVASAFVRMPLNLSYPDGHGLRLPVGTPLWAFARGVLAQRAWRWRDRVALLAAAAGWKHRDFACDAALTVAEFTAALPRAVRADLIEPLCAAALNTPAASASAQVFLRVIRDALFAGPGSADLMLPRLRLSDVLPEPAAAWLTRAGAAMQLSHRVEQLVREGDGWSVDGMAFDKIVLATSAAEAARLAQPHEPTWSAMAAELRYEPIVTVYLQSQGSRLPHPMLALRSDERQWPAQFVFDHGQLGGHAGLLAFVVSAAQPWVDRGMHATCDATMAQARHMLHGHLRGPLINVRVLTEKRATFRCTPDLRRPPGHIAPGLHAAGDYIAGPYPATLEGAVRSGLEAARALHSRPAH